MGQTLYLLQRYDQMRGPVLSQSSKPHVLILVHVQRPKHVDAAKKDHRRMQKTQLSMEALQKGWLPAIRAWTFDTPACMQFMWWQVADKVSI